VVGVSGGFLPAWPAEVRERALKRAAESGVKAAARQFERDGLNVSINTIRSWMRREGAKANRALELAGHVPPELLTDRVMGWHERRAALLPELGIAAASALEATKTAVKQGRSTDARNFATVTGILVDKLNILGGAATSRSDSMIMHVDVEQTRALQQKIQALEKELEHE